MAGIVMAYNVTEQHVDTDVEDENNVLTHNSSPQGSEESALNENSVKDFFHVDSDRLYFTGNDKSKGSRIWIQTAADPTKYNLYVFDEKKDGDDYYKCIQCTRYAHRNHIPSIIKVSQLGNENLQIWEKKNHYPSCNHDKSYIEKIQKKYQ
uniref:Uncharacterized protein n=1 Tax=Panagrolaimus superbus TaxID=310955 RepID=A0A914YEC5_9BILA